VAGNVQKGEAPTLFWDRLEIRLDEDLDGLVDESRHEPLRRQSLPCGVVRSLLE